MIGYLAGAVQTVGDRQIIVTVTIPGCTSGVGFAVTVPRPNDFAPHATASLFISFQWNQDRGPTLYGFAQELDKRVFELIIDVSKIGPSIGIAILAQMSATDFLTTCMTKNASGLSALHGIGPKKAELIVHELYEKARILLQKLPRTTAMSSTGVLGIQLSQALVSLGYTKAEIATALSHLNQLEQPPTTLDLALRTVLARLSQAKF